MRSVCALAFLFAVILCMSAAMESGYRVPANWPSPVYQYQNNAYTANKFKLGRVLFYDPVLSQDGSVSCASCHSPYSAFAHTDHALSHGIHDSIGIRNAPALMNLAWKQNLMWDGAIQRLDLQALAPITHAAEMGETLENVLLKLNRSNKYRKLFYEAWADSQATTQHMLYSLSQFMLKMVSNHSRFDSMQAGLIKYTEQENRGFQLFLTHCNRCHTSPLFTNDAFERNGISADVLLADSGRYRITRQLTDTFRFKVPTLRNIEFTGPYMHDGRYTTLYEVLNHYAGKSGVLNRPLTGYEKTDLMAFLLSLSDRMFLYDPVLSYPREQ